MVPVRTLALPELLECYLRARNNNPLRNPLDKRDENNTKKAFALLAECFPLADSSQIDREALEKFQIFLVNQTGRGGLPFSRAYCNALLKFVKTVFFWAMTQEPPMITEGRALALSKVRALMPSPKIRENKKRKNVPVKNFEALFPLLRPVVADMLQLQLMHAMRPSEVCNIKPCMIDFDSDATGNWLYQPETHKTASKGVERIFVFCKPSQEILKKYLPGTHSSEEHIFRNLKNNPFTVDVYDAIIRKTIEKHGLKKIVPYQARHTTATLTAKKHGIGYAQALLGHTTEQMTRLYVHDEVEKIQQIAAERNREMKTARPTPDPAPFPPILRIFTGE